MVLLVVILVDVVVPITAVGVFIGVAFVRAIITFCGRTTSRRPASSPSLWPVSIAKAGGTFLGRALKKDPSDDSRRPNQLHRASEATNRDRTAHRAHKCHGLPDAEVTVEVSGSIPVAISLLELVMLGVYRRGNHVVDRVLTDS
jgi:hypothetical protein